MDFITARNILRNSNYETEQERLNVESIFVRKKLNFGNYYYILLMDYQGDLAPHLTGNAILTDYGCTSEILGDLVSQDFFEVTCKKYGLDYRHFNIEKKFENIQDVDNFVKVLDEISAKYKEIKNSQED